MPPAIGHGVGTGFDGGRPFIPTDFPGCKLWLPAEQGISLLSPSVDRARWLDRSGNFNHLHQTAAARKLALSGKVLESDGVEYLVSASGIGVATTYTVGIALQIGSGNMPVSSQQKLAGFSETVGFRLVDYGAGDLRNQNHVGVGSSYWGEVTTAPETWVFRHDGAGNHSDFCLNGNHQTTQALGSKDCTGVAFHLGTVSGSFYRSTRYCAAVVYPSRLSDADTLAVAAWLAAQQAGTTPPALPAGHVLKVERPDWYSGQAVSDWANQGTEGALRDIAQALVAKQMVLIPKATPAGGPAVHGDGVDDFMWGAWTQGQPLHTFMAFLPSESGAANKYALDGALSSSMRILTMPAPSIQAYGGGGAGLAVNAAIDAWHRDEVQWNGPSGVHRVDDLTPATGSIGTASSDGMTLGARGGGTAGWADSLTAEIIQYDPLRTAAQQARLHAYLARHGC